MTTWQPITGLNDFNEELEKESMKGLWTSEVDLFCAPKPTPTWATVPATHWGWHNHVNGSSDKPAILFSTTDRPLLEAMGVYREEGKG